MRGRNQPARWTEASGPGAQPPRILPAESVDEETEALLAKTVFTPGQQPLNIFRTLAINPGLLKRFNVFAGYFISRATLPARVRELLILRVACRIDCRYEWQQHIHLGRAAGLTAAEIVAIEQASEHPWPSEEQAALAIADDLLDTDDISQSAWDDAVAKGWSEAQLIEMIMLVGSYRMVAGLLRSVRVPVDDRLAPTFTGDH